MGTTSPPGLSRRAALAGALVAAGGLLRLPAHAQSLPTLPPALRAAALGQAAVGSAPALVVLAAVESRSAARYAARAARYVAIEAGAAAQNLALQAVALGLGSVVVGAFDDTTVARVLQLPAGEPLLLLPIGARG